MLNIKTLLFEDVAKSKKILKDLNILESDSRYQKLKKLLEKNIGYLGLFTNFMFNNRVEYDELVQLYNQIQAEPAKFKKLPKPVTQYNSYVELQDALTEVEKDIKFQKAYKMLPKNVRELIDNNISKEVKDKLISLSDDFIKSYERLSKSEGKSPEQAESDKKELNDFYSGFALITGNQGDVSEVLNKIDLFVKKYANQLSFEKKVEEINNTNGAEVISANPQTKIIVAAVYSYEASKKIGSPHWCISYSNSHWNNYTNGNAQFFIWNYNYPVSDKNNLLGLTVTPDFSPYEFQNSLNEPVIVKGKQPMISYLKNINVPVEVLEVKIDDFNKERNKRRFEEIKKKNVNQISLQDIYFLAQYFYKTPEEMIDFLSKNYDKMPRFALPIIMEMNTGDKKKIIPDVINKFKGKFVDEDDFYYMINTDNLRKIYPESDPEKFRDTIIAKLVKERNPEDFDKTLTYAYIIHNLGRMSDAIKEIGVDKLNLLDENEIMLLVNRAISLGDKESIKLINSAGKLPNFKSKDILQLIYSLDAQGDTKAYEKIISIFGESFINDLSNDQVFSIIVNYPDSIFTPLFIKSGQELFDKLTPQQIQMIAKSENADRVKNFKQSDKEEEPKQEINQPKDENRNFKIYAELIKAKNKKDILSIIDKYGKTAIRQLDPSQVAKILKNTAHKKLVADTFGRSLVDKAINDPAGGAGLGSALNKEKLSPNNIAENQEEFELFPTLKNNDIDHILNSKEFQVSLVYDIINGLQNIHNIKSEKSDQMIIDKYTDYSWNSFVEEFEFDYDFEGEIIPLKIWIDNGEPVFMDETGTRFKMDWLNTEKGMIYKKTLLSNLKSF